MIGNTKITLLEIHVLKNYFFNKRRIYWKPMKWCEIHHAIKTIISAWLAVWTYYEYMCIRITHHVIMLLNPLTPQIQREYFTEKNTLLAVPCSPRRPTWLTITYFQMWKMKSILQILQLVPMKRIFQISGSVSIPIAT